MTTPLGDLLRELRDDPVVRAAFRESPDGYLLQRGWGELAPDELQEACYLLADAAPTLDAGAWTAAGDVIGELGSGPDPRAWAVGFDAALGTRWDGGAVDHDPADLDDADLDKADLDKADLDKADLDKAGDSDLDTDDDHAGLDEPDLVMSDPEMSDPEMPDPEMPDPEMPDPVMSDLDRPDHDFDMVSGSEASGDIIPDRTDLDPTDLDPTDLDPTDLDPTDLDPGRSGPDEPGPADPSELDGWGAATELPTAEPVGDDPGRDDPDGDDTSFGAGSRDDAGHDHHTAPVEVTPLDPLGEQELPHEPSTLADRAIEPDGPFPPVLDVQHDDLHEELDPADSSSDPDWDDPA